MLRSSEYNKLRQQYCFEHNLDEETFCFSCLRENEDPTRPLLEDLQWNSCLGRHQSTQPNQLHLRRASSNRRKL